ncbi:MAG: hypothetical protein RLZZ387_2620 [Chloroflexota bacterium]|jgi:hypothetical protein
MARTPKQKTTPQQPPLAVEETTDNAKPDTSERARLLAMGQKKD